MAPERIREYMLERIERNFAEMKTARSFLELSDFMTKTYESFCIARDIDAINLSEFLAYCDRHYGLNKEMIKVVFSREYQPKAVTE